MRRLTYSGGSMRRRRRENLWIHRWSRWIIAACASVGAFGTAYLTIVKVMGGGAACPTGGCDRVLASDYATVFGVPLTIFGFLAYASMAALASGPLLLKSETNPSLSQRLESMSWPLLLIVSLAMVVFSGYLMYLLAFELRELCLYCITSAVLSVAMLMLTLLGRVWDDVGQVLFTGVIVSVITLTSTLAIYAPTSNGGAQAGGIAGEAGPPVTTVSSPDALTLAQHLTDTGAKMYGAWWCPHCHDQKQLFGAEAAKQIPYIECAEDGQNPQPALCSSEPEVTGFPTWEINGQFYPGSRSLEDLATASGYSGSMNFQTLQLPQ